MLTYVGVGGGGLGGGREGGNVTSDADICRRPFGTPRAIRRGTTTTTTGNGFNDAKPREQWADLLPDFLSRLILLLLLTQLFFSSFVSSFPAPSSPHFSAFSSFSLKSSSPPFFLSFPLLLHLISLLSPPSHSILLLLLSFFLSRSFFETFFLD